MNNQLPSQPMKDDKALTLDMVVRQGFVPIYVHDELDSHVLVEGAVQAGCEVLEYTCRRHDAREMIPWIKKEFPHVKVLGATLIDGDRVEASLRRKVPHFIGIDEMCDLGVDGLVSLLRFRPETYAKHGERLVMVPGVGTANEAIDQLELGADLVKAIVATTAGEELVCKSRMATHNALPFLITGGVTAERLTEMIAFGVVVGTAGFDLILKSDLEAGLPTTCASVTRRIRTLLDVAREARQRHQPELLKAIEGGARDLMNAGPWVAGR